MYIFFDNDNVATKVLTEGEVFRQGDVNAHTIFTSSENYNNVSYMAFIQFERSDGSKSPELYMTENDFTYLEESYSGFKKLINDEWILALDGELKITVRYRNSLGVVAASGTVVMPVEKTVYSDEPMITINQYNELLSLFDKYLLKNSRRYPHVVNAMPEDLIDYLTGGEMLDGLPEDLTDYQVGAILFIKGAGDDLDNVYEVYLDDDELKDIRLVSDINDYLKGTIILVKPEDETYGKFYEVYDNGGTLETRKIDVNGVHDLTNITLTSRALIVSNVSENGVLFLLKLDMPDDADFETESDTSFLAFGDLGVENQITAIGNGKVIIFSTDSPYTTISCSATKAELDAEITKIIDGTYTAKKAEQDKNGNAIDTTYLSDVEIGYGTSNRRVALTMKDGNGDSKATDYVDLPLATSIVDGLMPKADKAKLDELPTNAELESALGLKADKSDTYTKEEVYTKTETYTKTEVNNLVSSVYKFKGSVDTFEDLPTEDLTIGDVYNVIDSGINYAWDGTDWDDIGGVEALATATNNGLMSKEDFIKLRDLSKTTVGLGNVDNTSDVNKPISAATQSALDLIASKVCVSTTMENAILECYEDNDLINKLAFAKTTDYNQITITESLLAKYENGIHNGNFATTDNWTGLGTSSFTVDSNVATIVGSGSSVEMTLRRTGNLVSAIVGQKVYYKITFNALEGSPRVKVALLEYNSSGGFLGETGVSNQYTLTANANYSLSAIGTITNADCATIRINISSIFGSAGDALGKTLRISKVVIINLNDYNIEAYTLNQCDSLFGARDVAISNNEDVGYANYTVITNDGLLKITLIDNGDTYDFSATPLDNLVEITYDDLVDLRDGGELVAGTSYRITDYITTTTQSGTQSAEHPFDIIVVADSNNTLNENARAILHSGDTYFVNSNLSAWKLKYCLDNDDSRFAWADDENGKGVIYEMIDEHNNNFPFDFKNIMFDNDAGTYFYYVFSWFTEDGAELWDASIHDELTNDEGQNKRVQNNHALPRMEPGDNKFSLSKVIFEAHYDDGGFLYGWRKNFLNNLNNGKFGDNCNNYAFGDDNSFIILDDFSSSNTLGDYCSFININSISGEIDNLHISNNVGGSSALNPLIICDSVSSPLIENKNFPIYISRDASGKIVMRWLDDQLNEHGLYKNSSTDELWSVCDLIIDGGTF